MRLSPDQVERFYAIWIPLILFVNQKLRVEPEIVGLPGDKGWNPAKVFPIREALWANDAVREAFIAENPAKLSTADRAVVASWRYRVAGSFTVFRHLKKHSLLIGGKPEQVYAVVGLKSSIDELVPFTPCLVKAVLLPFEEQITFDSLMVPYNVHLGPGIRRSLTATYNDARERGAIVTSLLPPTEASHEEEQARASEVDARVLDQFRKHEYRTGRTPKVVERDLATIATFAEFLAANPEPSSLRDFGEHEVRAYLTRIQSTEPKEPRRKQIVTGLTRFHRFLRDTGRMAYWGAQDVLDALKGKE